MNKILRNIMQKGKKKIDNIAEDYKDVLNLKKDGKISNDWLLRHWDFTEKIEKEYSYYLEKWLDTRGKHPDERIIALRDFIIYLEKTKVKCENKGECYAAWFNSYLINEDYIARRQEDLEDLEKNYDKFCRIYNIKKYEEPKLEEKLIKIIEQYPNILQKDIYDKFDNDMKEFVSNKIYELDKNGKITRQKNGPTYSITIN